MLTALESKMVISTLTKRRSWLKKALEDASLDGDLRAEYREMLAALESAMKKLASIASKAPAKAEAKPEQKPRAKPSLETMRVLVAEDQEESLEIIVSILRDIGVKEIDEAKDGREAFDKIKAAEAPYHAILCDWDMPELSGLEVHRKAKDSNTLGDAYFCMVTGVSEAKKIREAIQQGVDDYVVKPVDPSILDGKIRAQAQPQSKAS